LTDTIKVLAVRSLDGSSPLKAFVDLQVNGWTINDFRIVKQNGQRAWVSPPQASWRDGDGQTHYRSILSVPGELKQRIEVAVLSAWELDHRNGKS
jgi:hypothetical protein